MNEGNHDSAGAAAPASDEALQSRALQVLFLTPRVERWKDLLAALNERGLEVPVAASLAAAPAQVAPTVLLVDSELPPCSYVFPFVVVSSEPTGEADQGRMEAAVANGAYCYSTSTIDATNLLVNIRAAANHAGRLNRMVRRAESLAASLRQDQAASMAIGILMERFNLTHVQAWERLRGYSRDQRRRVADVAQQITNVANEYGSLLDAVVGSGKA